MRTPHALFAATAALVAAAVVPPSPAAAAVPVAGTYYVQSATTGLNAADNGGAVEQHNPKGNEEHQQWNLRGSGPSYVLESADTQGSCLGRSGDQARTVSCTSADAAWDIAPEGDDQYTLKAPGTERHLTVGARASGSNYPAQLTVGPSGGLATWYLTPVDSPTGPMPSPDRRTLDQVTFLTAHNAYANGVDGGFAANHTSTLVVAEARRGGRRRWSSTSDHVASGPQSVRSLASRARRRRERSRA